MDINLLVVNAGNTRLALGAFVGGELTHVVRVPIEDRAGWPDAIREVWKRVAGASGPDAMAIVGSSVNPPVLEALEMAIENVAEQEVNWIGNEIPLPTKVLTESPSETGVDRVLNVAAAYEQMGKACMVVDAGSAITINCCNDAGQFLGGAIAPGASMQLAALHAWTAKLPELKYGAPDDAPYGRSTKQAMLQGVHHGIRGLVKETAERFAMDLGTWPDIIATGGDAKALFEGWELIHAISPDLTLYGIALAYVNHAIEEEK